MNDCVTTLAEARDTWFESAEGKQCCDGSASGEFLHNRLEAAFLAGANLAEQLTRKEIAGDLKALMNK